MNLSASIVTYNDQAEALRAAASVLEHTRRHPLTLYLVDNASTDGTGAGLEAAAAGGRLAAFGISAPERYTGETFPQCLHVHC